MSRIFLTADTHFCHDKEFVYKPRGFNSIYEMNETIVKNWNSVVNWDDEVYLLGDCMLNNNYEGIKLLNRLAGKIYILRGNHDTNSRIQEYVNIRPTILYIGLAQLLKYDGYTFYLSHYPTFTSNLENGAPLKKHVINLYGHTHQKTNFYNEIPFMYHVGLDSHNCFPVLIDDVITDIKEEVKKCKEQL